ncbi:MAG: DUF6266 family protein [Marinifilaceae bacterium]
MYCISCKGVNYLKSLPGPNTSNSEKQQQQRQRFKAITGLASSLMGALIRPVWNLASGQMTGYNLFVKTNMPAFDSEGQLVNYSEFHASVGSLPLPSELSVQDDTDVVSGIELSWNDESANGIGHADDKLHLLVIKGDQVQVVHPSAIRSDQTVEVTLPVAPGEIQVYAFFGDDEGSQYSTDQYGSVTLT